jgi:hypothetical protein
MHDDTDRLQEGEDYRANTKIFDMTRAKDRNPNAIPVEKRTTTRFMTKYERARLLGTRALQLRHVVLFWCRPEMTFAIA